MSDAERPEAPLVAVVDDDPSVRRSTLRLLRCCGLRAETFASAEEFLQSGRVDGAACLLLDVRMPGMNGLELQRRVADIAPTKFIVFISAQASEEEERRALQSGAAVFLRKPFGKETLLRAILPAIKAQRNKPRDERNYE